ncbi:Uma2 family endonuclease [Aerosakkonemataceae cyanobacterium BLCC-F50]|uniref:Uma2 family endonuclease n=1 Tax=Floridaenema flaviceps BLCC-F50 TaxID=3153642 RepID=A0ABV4Y1Z4_9CYAN
MTEIMAKILPLENGDRLTRAEFERRYQTMPNLKKAELIEGVVYMGSPVRVTHGQPHAGIMTWLGTYWTATPGVGLFDNTTVRLDADNEPQPDALLRIENGGQTIISEDDYLEGAPEFIAEIAASSASYDLRDKLRVYRRNQVQEYLVWQVNEQKIDWFRLREGEYIVLPSDATGTIKSEVFPGLWLAVPALIAGNLVEVQSVLQMGLATSEHQIFVERLRG